MYEFITLLRALAAVIITNAHYENIYPISIIANGGLWGDVIFFSVSGFCLCNVKNKPFISWYAKRIVRVYPAVWIITIVYLLLGFYTTGSVQHILKLLFYPTYYHFVASILLLYILYYVVMYVINRINSPLNLSLFVVLGIVILVHCILYLTVYDRSYYHIDSVYEPMIRMLFFEAMLIGAIVRENCEVLTQKFRLKYLIAFLGTFVIYFSSKIAFSRIESLAPFQIINQFILLVLLIFTILLVSGFERKLEKLPPPLLKVIRYISSITLEIYVVQYALIPRLNIGSFPINFVFVTGGILITASVLHVVAQKVQQWALRLMPIK